MNVHSSLQIDIVAQYLNLVVAQGSLVIAYNSLATMGSCKFEWTKNDMIGVLNNTSLYCILTT